MIGADLTRKFISKLIKVSKLGVGIVDRKLSKDALPKEALFLHRLYGDQIEILNSLGINERLRINTPEPKYEAHGDQTANLIFGPAPLELVVVLT